jgi:hypothetical protein
MRWLHQPRHAIHQFLPIENHDVSRRRILQEHNHVDAASGRRRVSNRLNTGRLQVIGHALREIQLIRAQALPPQGVQTPIPKRTRERNVAAYFDINSKHHSGISFDIHQSLPAETPLPSPISRSTVSSESDA